MERKNGRSGGRRGGRSAGPPPDPGAEAALARLFSSGFVVVDFETTSLADDPLVAIVQVGLVDSSGAVLLDTLVNPHRSIARSSTAVHGIRDRDVAGAPRFARIHPDLDRLLGGRIAVAYNAAFEEKVLGLCCDRARLPAPAVDSWVCAQRLYVAIRRLRDWPKLAAACARESLMVGTAHRAVDDCRMTLALLAKLAGEAPELPRDSS